MSRILLILVGVLLAVAGLGLLATRPRADKAPAAPADDVKMVEALQKSGARLQRDDKAPGKPVVGVVFQGGQYEDRHLAPLSGLKRLNSLQLLYTSVTNKGL